jgi:ureidoglycolate lyase
MKLLRYGPKGHERPGVLDSDGRIRDLSGIVSDIDGTTIGAQGLERLQSLDLTTLPVVEGQPRLGPCVGKVGKLVCIGLNYSDHAAESGMQVPPEPVIFMKATTSICGPNDDVEIPRGSESTDWEVELAFVIGRHAKYVSESEAMDYVAGYCICNDVSERTNQAKRHGQWTKGKSHDTHGPLGPWLVTKDEVPDPHDLAMTLEVDGHRYQNGSTRTMVYKVPFLVSYLSQFMSLQPGDVVSTGTPPGVGLGIKPTPVYLKAGQTMRLTIERLGEQRQRTVPA